MRQLIGTTAEWAADDLVIGDGEIALERTVSSQLLIKIGNGVDTFLDLPYLTVSAFGPEYSWRDVTGSRSLATNYTSPAFPIQISVKCGFVANSGQTTLTVGGVVVAIAANGGNGAMFETITAIIPPATVYRIDQTNMDSIAVFELRAD